MPMYGEGPPTGSKDKGGTPTKNASDVSGDQANIVVMKGKILHACFSVATLRTLLKSRNTSSR